MASLRMSLGFRKEKARHLAAAGLSVTEVSNGGSSFARNRAARLDGPSRASVEAGMLLARLQVTPWPLICGEERQG